MPAPMNANLAKFHRLVTALYDATRRVVVCNDYSLADAYPGNLAKMATAAEEFCRSAPALLAALGQAPIVTDGDVDDRFLRVVEDAVLCGVAPDRVTARAEAFAGRYLQPADSAD